jgi:uncharacterized protein (UPF0333 family)
MNIFSEGAQVALAMGVLLLIAVITYGVTLLVVEGAKYLWKKFW